MGFYRPSALGGISLIVVCFLGSAALRLSDDGYALAEGIGSMARAGTARQPTSSDDSDRDLLLDAIREREAQLVTEEARLAERRQTLNVAETKLTEQLKALETARENLEKTLALADEAAERDIAHMTTVYENMKPTDAARIFEKMDITFAAGLLSRMRPDLAALVLTSMEAEGAYALTVTIASRNARVPKE